jgi:hypothetical protein
MQTTEQSKTLAKNYNAVKENIKKACEQAGRSQEEVTLLAVSKTKPVDMLMRVPGTSERIKYRNWWTRYHSCLRISDGT